MSVLPAPEPRAPDGATALVRALVDEWVRAGVRDACVAPGSRSTPLALALVADGRLRVHVGLDERSMAFFALGTARASGLPAVVLCTSGTAAANFHPAVLEAHHGYVPLIVCTADRPPELRDHGAGQTVDQHGLFGSATRWAFDPGPPEWQEGAGAMWRQLGARSVAEALGPPPGVVHLNLPFREPLMPTGGPVPDVPGRADGAPWTVATRVRREPDDALVDRLAATVRATERGLLVGGWGADVRPETAARFAAASGWPILADPLSGLRVGDAAVSTYDALLRVPAFGTTQRPDLVLRVGAPLTSKVASSWLAAGNEIERWVVGPDGRWLDPDHAVSSIVRADADALLGALADRLGLAPPETTWSMSWVDAERRARGAIDDVLDSWDEPFEGRIARDLIAGVPEGSTVVVASSMPVRDVEWFAAPRGGVRVVANRGVNGIDGFNSTVLGVAAAAPGPVVALVGDLCFLHDSNGLLGAAQRGVDATFVVVDNDGGGIFSFLAQHDDREHFERLFSTPQGVDLAALAAVHGLPVVKVEKAADLAPAVTESIRAGGVRVVLVRTDREENLSRHRQVWVDVAQHLA